MKNIYRLFEVLHRWKGYYLLAGLLLIVSSFVQMLQPKVLQIAIDGVVLFAARSGERATESVDQVAAFLYRLLPEVRMDNLHWVLVGIALLFVGISTVQALARFVSSKITADSTEKAIKRLRDRLFAHIQALPLAHIGKAPTGETIQRCTGDVDTVRNFIGTQVVELLRLTAVFAGAFAMMCSVHVTYALLAVALVPLIGITAFVFFSKEGKVWQEHEGEQDKLTGIIQENLAGIRVVQAFAKEDYEIDKFIRQNKAKLKIGIRHVDLHMRFWPFADFLVNLQVAISLLAGGYFTLMQQITMGEFVSFFTYSIMVAWPMRAVGRIVSQMGMAAVAIERITQILDAETEDYSGEDKGQQALKGNIEFRNVVFRYKDDEQNALNGVSFTVSEGENVALLGPTGAGKSTIIALLARFYEPISGEILLDGQPLSSYSKTYLRSRVGIVHQRPFLFSTSIRENIAYTQPELSDEKVIAAAKAAAAHDFISKIKDGYNTVVGERGVTLSGGQKQRVALARTLLSNPDILVLDDATSSVDTETEFSIQQALENIMGGKTTFIIAHRLTSIQQADKIIVLDKGEIIEMGTQAELLTNNGFYRQVYNIQIAIEDDIEQELVN